jgi:hypothetical protein
MLVNIVQKLELTNLYKLHFKKRIKFYFNLTFAFLDFESRLKFKLNNESSTLKKVIDVVIIP